MWGFLFLELLAKGAGVDMTDKRLAEIEAREKAADLDDCTGHAIAMVKEASHD